MVTTENENNLKLLKDFKSDLVKLCAKYKTRLKSDGDYGISIEVILADDGYSRELEYGIWKIDPDGVSLND